MSRFVPVARQAWGPNMWQVAARWKRICLDAVDRHCFGRRADLGHGTERQVAHYLWGIRLDHRNRYRFAAHWIIGRDILDVACGVGYGSYLLGRYDRARRVVGVDNSAEAISFAKSCYTRPNVVFRCADANELVGKATFDTIVSFETLEHIDDEKRFMTVLGQMARPRCRLVVSTPNEERYPFCPRGNPYHVRHHTPVALERLLAETGWMVMERYCQRDNFPGHVVRGTQGRFLVYVAQRAS
jgi:2-polyprenyl-3-methyl-5-hydroxy-6-metoxy-1,4-benzoquinol methylase